MSHHRRPRDLGHRQHRNAIRRWLLHHGPFCALCDHLVPRGQQSIDHRIPLSAGGTNTSINLQLAHRRCNDDKGRVEGAAWRARRRNKVLEVVATG